jgi:hypothetical protein
VCRQILSAHCADREVNQPHNTANNSARPSTPLAYASLYHQYLTYAARRCPSACYKRLGDNEPSLKHIVLMDGLSFIVQTTNTV